MSTKVFCKECNLVYNENEIAKYHNLTNLKNHTFIKENNSFEAISYLCDHIKNLEKKNRRKLQSRIRIIIYDSRK